MAKSPKKRPRVCRTDRSAGGGAQDKPKRKTKGGIALPDAAEIPTITGRIVTIDPSDAYDGVSVRQYDRILFGPERGPGRLRAG